MNYKNTNKLEIFKDSIHAGTLSRIEGGCFFTFSNDFIKSDIKNLTFNLNKNKPTHRFIGHNLPPFFANLLPEGLRLRALVKNLKTSEDDMFSLFAATGSSVIGDIHTKPISEPNNKTANKLKEIDFYELFAKTITTIIPTAEGNDTFAGIQEKLSASMITFPLNIAGTDKSYIIKLNSQNHTNLVENEYYSMLLAAKCGIKTAKNKIVKDKNNNKGLLVERFDRERKDNKLLMHHQEDACQFLEKYPSEKYRISLNQIADKIMILSTAAPVMILELLKQYCFSYLLGNGDLHAKNISLLQKNGSSFIELSPAYDIITTSIYNDNKMAIKINGRDDNIKFKTILDFSQHYGIPEKATKLMILKLITNFEKNLSIIENIPMPPKTLKKQYYFMNKRINLLTP